MSRRPDTEWIALAPTTRAADVDALIDRAVAHGVAAVVVPPAFARRAVDRAAGRLGVASVVSHPLGLDKPTVKAIAATSLAKDGVAGLIVTPLVANLSGDLEAFRQESLEIARGARAARSSIGLAVRIDLAWGPLDVAAIGAAVLRGAFDGVAIEGDDPAALANAVRAARAVDGLAVTAIARDAGWVDAFLAAGAQRVGVLR